MSVLPQTAAGFTDPTYWKNFFAARKSPFEWYGDYESLNLVFDKYMKSSDKILHIGCGSSELATQLYDNGYRIIHSIDTDASVIENQKRKNKSRPDLTFAQDDVMQLSCGDESYSVVLDKGTFDALLPPNPSDAEKADCLKMLQNVDRALTAGGRHIVITLAQKQIIDLWFEYYNSTYQYLLRVQKVPNSANGFPMPVFALIATKMKTAFKFPMPLEFMSSDATKAVRLSKEDNILDMVRAEQELAQFIHMCRRKLENEVSIDFYGSDPSLGPRYRLFVVDNPEMTVCTTFGMFIVPAGRDGEWLFATPKGRQNTRSQCQRDRLVIVFLNRNQQYCNVEDVKSEIADFFKRLDIRPKEHKGTIQILSMNSVDVRNTVATGTSACNGPWTVEEIDIEDTRVRRLVFLNTLNLVQSEALLRKDRKKKKHVLYLDKLSCEFHIMMLAGLCLSSLEPFKSTNIQKQYKLAVIGLGGGLFTTLLYRALPKTTVTSIELDPEVIKIARTHFGLPGNDDRMIVKCMDGLEFMKDSAGKEDKFDVLFLDVSSSQGDLLQCPPSVFLTEEAVKNMKNTVNENGLVIMNVVTRDEDLFSEIKSRMKANFDTVLTIRSDQYVNEIIVCGNANLGINLEEKKKNIIENLRSDFNNYHDVIASLRKVRID